LKPFGHGSGDRTYAVLGALLLLGAITARFVVLPGIQGPETLPWPNISLWEGDRILILAPHPDDESLNCGAIIQKALRMGLSVHIAWLTYGDFNQWSFLVYRYRTRPVVTPGEIRRMGLIRHDEAVAAAGVLGLSSQNLTFLGYPDHGTLDIFTSHWGDRPAYQSPLTQEDRVPYSNALRPGAPYKGEEVLKDLTTVIRDFRPTKVFVSHPSDHHPDHRALYLFTTVALWNLRSELAPEVYPYLTHYPSWPKPTGYHPSKLLEPPNLYREQIAWQAPRVTTQELRLKKEALKKHRTQWQSFDANLRSFLRGNELFGDFPLISLDPFSNLSLEPNTTGKFASPSAQLNSQEKAAFVGIQWRSMRSEGGYLNLSITLSRPIGKAVEAYTYFLGYRSDTPFENMPKLYVKFGDVDHAVYDQNRALPKGSLEVSRQTKELSIRIPLQLLGNPERLLIGAKTNFGFIPLDWTSWRIVDLSPTGS